MRRFIFFVSLLSAGLIVDAWLIANPNWLGRLGFWIYKYHYLKTFPKALLTLSLVAGALGLVCFMIYTAVRRKWMKRKLGTYSLYALAFVIGLLLINVIITFSKGNYSHTGTGFRTGANLLPCLLLFVVGFTGYELRLLKKKKIVAVIDEVTGRTDHDDT